MMLDGLDFSNFFLVSIFHALHSIDTFKVKIKNIRNTHAVSTNQIEDILHFKAKYGLTSEVLERMFDMSNSFIQLRTKFDFCVTKFDHEFRTYSRHLLGATIAPHLAP